MALTSTQQNKILYLLGYGGKTLQSGSVIYNKILADRLTALPTDTETLVVALLASITSMETRITAAPDRLAATQIDDIKLNRDELSMLRTEKKRIAKEIAVHLDIPYLVSSGMVGVIN